MVFGILLVAGVAHGDDVKGYVLGAGDKIRVTVFNEPDLSGVFDVNGQGLISVPLLGQVKVIGLTAIETQALLTEKYGKEYLVKPSVTVEVMNYRPFFILGEVKSPGSYPYVDGMTVINAVALAGGYTPRANHDGIKIKHGNDPKAVEHDVQENTPVLPGDIIQVAERFF